jgi:hypothetical protein
MGQKELVMVLTGSRMGVLLLRVLPKTPAPDEGERTFREKHDQSNFEALLAGAKASDHRIARQQKHQISIAVRYFKPPGARTRAENESRLEIALRMPSGATCKS